MMANEYYLVHPLHVMLFSLDGYIIYSALKCPGNAQYQCTTLHSMNKYVCTSQCILLLLLSLVIIVT